MRKRLRQIALLAGMVVALRVLRRLGREFNDSEHYG